MVQPTQSQQQPHCPLFGPAGDNIQSKDVAECVIRYLTCDDKKVLAQVNKAWYTQVRKIPLKEIKKFILDLDCQLMKMGVKKPEELLQITCSLFAFAPNGPNPYLVKCCELKLKVYDTLITLSAEQFAAIKKIVPSSHCGTYALIESLPCFLPKEPEKLSEEQTKIYQEKTQENCFGHVEKSRTVDPNDDDVFVAGKNTGIDMVNFRFILELLANEKIKPDQMTIFGKNLINFIIEDLMCFILTNPQSGIINTLVFDNHLLSTLERIAQNCEKSGLTHASQDLYSFLAQVSMEEKNYEKFYAYAQKLSLSNAIILFDISILKTNSHYQGLKSGSMSLESCKKMVAYAEKLGALAANEVEKEAAAFAKVLEDLEARNLKAREYKLEKNSLKEREMSIVSFQDSLTRSQEELQLAKQFLAEYEAHIAKGECLDEFWKKYK